MNDLLTVRKLAVEDIAPIPAYQTWEVVDIYSRFYITRILSQIVQKLLCLTVVQRVANDIFDSLSSDSAKVANDERAHNVSVYVYCLVKGVSVGPVNCSDQRVPQGN